MTMTRQPMAPAPARPSTPSGGAGPVPPIQIRSVSRRFGSVVALDDVSLTVGRGEIHALLGPNGAGKTTLLRIVTGLVEPDAGEVRLQGSPLGDFPSKTYRRLLGLIPAGDRTFYLRLSGYENLLFFGRLQGLGRARAAERARAGLAAVGLEDAAKKPVGLYSHGMHKRLSVARALLAEPAVLLVDEATHDLDPEAAHRVRELIRDLAAAGVGVLWTTQRLDEIQGFAQRAVILHRGCVRFSGTITQLTALVDQDCHVLRLGSGGHDHRLVEVASAALVGRGSLSAIPGDGDHFVMSLQPGVVLGDAIAALAGASVPVLACRQERSQLEQAFLHLVGTARS